MTLPQPPDECWEHSPEAADHPLAGLLSVWRAEHCDPSLFDPLIKLCAEAIPDTAGPQSLVRFARGFHDFTIDLLGEKPEEEREPVRVARRHAFRQVVLGVERLDQMLGELDTGPLMRTVVQTRSGIVHCGRVRPGEYLVAAARDVDDLELTDRRLCTLVTKIRNELHGLSDEDPGGYSDALVSLERSGPISNRPGESAFSPDVRQVMDANLSVDDLHYLALYKDWRPVYSCDVFDAPRLKSAFFTMTRHRRRELYDDLVHKARRDINHLGRSVRDVIGAGPIRIVLDVESGAVYTHVLDLDGDFLVGVTLRQSAVFRAEKRMQKVVQHILRSPADN
ncbi:hypothetical protein GCM10009677_44390 [Sphaerisporangium rubeum]|uniref:Uncharacterized protein n=1 Tax=Sphaerisporangium rubeum TaxID=321317 RepID=A0A7X0I9F4_9ACTN|nr:hypothetical protein [Sphaerisporangium rubeum]MBB6471046.1 hypothetical protein [Sphaerisporangium rubeum]